MDDDDVLTMICLQVRVWREIAATIAMATRFALLLYRKTYYMHILGINTCCYPDPASDT